MGVRLALCSLALVALASCSSTPRRNPLFDRDLLPPAGFRAVARQDAVLNVWPVIDPRSAEGVEPSLAEAGLLITVRNLVQGYLVREIQASRLMREVCSGQHLHADLELAFHVMRFEGETGGGLAAGSGFGAVEFRAVCKRSSDGTMLLDKRYVHQVTEKRNMMVAPDALKLTCEALRDGVAELLVDLSRIDVGQAGP